MDMLLWGPGLDAELEFRRERMTTMWGRPLWADRVAGSLARRRAAHRSGAAGDAVRRGARPVAVRAARAGH